MSGNYHRPLLPTIKEAPDENAAGATSMEDSDLKWIEAAEEEVRVGMTANYANSISLIDVIESLVNNMRFGYTTNEAVEDFLHLQMSQTRAYLDQLSANADSKSTRTVTDDALQQLMKSEQDKVQKMKAIKYRFKILRHQTRALHKCVSDDEAFDKLVFTEYYKLVPLGSPLMDSDFELNWKLLRDMRPESDGVRTNPVYLALCDLKSVFDDLLESYFTVRQDYGIALGRREKAGRPVERGSDEHVKLEFWLDHARISAGLFTLFGIELLFWAQHFAPKGLAKAGAVVYGKVEGLEEIPAKAKALWRDVLKAKRALSHFQRDLQAAETTGK